MPNLSTIHLPYGSSYQLFTYNGPGEFDQIFPNNVPSIHDPQKIIKDCLTNPIDKVIINNDLKNKKIGISVNDTTRPVPNSLLLPPLLEYLSKREVKNENIAFFIASGTHKKTFPNENELIFPESIIKEYVVFRHDCDDEDNLVFLGDTSRKTPIYINKRFYEQDLKIVSGNIEPHHFMGYSGGAKSAAIGLAGRETIRINHSHLMESESFIGNYNSNPTRMDLEEIGDRIGITAALNVVLNSEKQIVHVLWGTARGVMKVGIPISQYVCQKKVNRLYDLVIATPGGYPKDINLYQAQKAITHVNLITRERGTIILVAECREGLGSLEFENYLGKFSSLNDVIGYFESHKFVVGPHKAYQLALQAVRNRIIIVSSIPTSIIGKTHIEYASSLSDAMNMAATSLPSNPAVAVVPYATNTMLF